MVKPKMSRKKNVATIATGTAIAGMIVERKSCKNKNTTMKTRINASINVDFTCFVLSSKRSFVLISELNLIPGGKVFAAFSTSFFTPISIAFAFDPEVCIIATVTAFLLFAFVFPL
ncbi:hypothetical protein D3C85_1432710 [compost metagenome]